MAKKRIAARCPCPKLAKAHWRDASYNIEENRLTRAGHARLRHKLAFGYAGRLRCPKNCLQMLDQTSFNG